MKRYFSFLLLSCLSTFCIAQVISPSVLVAKNDETNLPADVNKIYNSSDRLKAEFPGGEDMFRKKVADAMNLDLVKIQKGEKSVKTNIVFVVERDGSLTEIKALGSNSSFNSAAIEAVKTIKIKWIPANYNKTMVRSIFNLPLMLEIIE